MPTNDDRLREILAKVQEQTILVDCTGSVLGPKEDARVFKAILDTAEADIMHLFNTELQRQKDEALEMLSAKLKDSYRQAGQGSRPAFSKDTETRGEWHTRTQGFRSGMLTAEKYIVELKATISGEEK